MGPGDPCSVACNGKVRSGIGEVGWVGASNTSKETYCTLCQTKALAAQTVMHSPTQTLAVPNPNK